MHISRNDGRFDNQTSHQRDTIVNMGTFLRLGNMYETPEEYQRKKQLIEKRNRLIQENKI